MSTLLESPADVDLDPTGRYTWPVEASYEPSIEDLAALPALFPDDSDDEAGDAWLARLEEMATASEWEDRAALVYGLTRLTDEDIAAVGAVG